MIEVKPVIPGKLPQLSPEVFRVMGDIHFPTSRNSDSSFDQSWIRTVETHWPTFRTIALQVLSSHPSHRSLTLLPNSEASLNEEFTLPKQVINHQLVGMRGKDLKYIYRYFVLGEEVAKKDDSESILKITRKELLQLFIAAFARKYMLLRYEIPQIEDTYPFKNTTTSRSYGESRLFDRWDKLIRQKPEGGGPIINAR